MQQLFFIHPLGQACAFVFGIFNAVTGITRKWFNLAIHINCGALYYFMVLLGAGAGSLIAQWGRARGVPVDMNVHKITAMLMVVLLAAGATTGIAMLRGIGQRMRLLRCHRWINIAGLLLFVLQGMIGIAMLLQLFRT